MGLDVSYTGLVAFLLALARAVAWLIVVPPFSDRKVIPSTVTMAIGSGLALLVVPTLPASAIPQDAAGLIAALALQVLTGLAMGFVLNLMLAAITAAGSLVDLAGGLNLPTAIDPLSLDQTPMIGQFYQQVALLLLFVSGGYLIVVNGFVRSFQAPGFTLGVSGRVAGVLAADLATYITSAVEMAAPILVVLFATQIVLALVSRAAPQMNVWILGLPLQIFLALALVAVAISAVPTYLTRLVGRAVGDAAAMFGGP